MRGHKMALSLMLTMFLGSCAPAVGGEPASSDSQTERFRQEYETLNAKNDMSGEDVYQTVSVPANLTLYYADESVLRGLFEKGSGILYLGFPECPWCRTLLPVLFEAIASTGYADAFYYYNALSDRSTLSLDAQGAVVTEREGAELYQFLLVTLDEYLESYNGLNDPSIKRVYFPTTVFIKNGKIESVHLNTLDGQEKGFDPLTPAQHLELLSALRDQIRQIQ